MKISLILLNYNECENTIMYIEFIRKYEIIDNIIVVDNCSTNDSFERLKAYASERVIVMELDKNGGYAYGNNYGIRYAKVNYNPDYFLISNPDVYFKENIIEKMINVYESDNKIAMVAPRVINNENSNIPIAWNLPGFGDNICMLFIVLGKIFKKNKYYDKNNFIEDVFYVDVLPGSFFMIKAEVFYEINLFDEGTFLYGEENIVAYKLKKHGYKNVILNRITYLHEHSGTIDKTYNSKIAKYKILYESLSYYNIKYLNTNKIKNLMFWVIWKISNVEKFLLGG